MWAIKAKGHDVYYAESQFGPPGSITISSLEGRPPFYRPKRFKTQREAEKTIEGLSVSAVGAGKTEWKWEVVELKEKP